MVSKTPEEFITAMNSALENDNFLTAQEISFQAIDQYPDHEEIKKFALILAPPKITSVKRPTNPDLQANREWIKHNRNQHRGSWVALKGGKLLATGKDIDELVAQVGKLKNTGILVTAIY